MSRSNQEATIISMNITTTGGGITNIASGDMNVSYSNYGNTKPKLPSNEKSTYISLNQNSSLGNVTENSSEKS